MQSPPTARHGRPDRRRYHRAERADDRLEYEAELAWHRSIATTKDIEEAFFEVQALLPVIDGLSNCRQTPESAVADIHRLLKRLEELADAATRDEAARTREFVNDVRVRISGATREAVSSASKRNGLRSRLPSIAPDNASDRRAGGAS